MNFFEKLNTSILRSQSLLVVGLEPNLEIIPNDICNHQDQEILGLNLFSWLQSVVTQTQEYVCAYKPTLGYYEVLGAMGMKLLAQVLAIIPDHIPIILDAKHGDINTSTIFARTIFQEWQIDAITLTPYTGQDHIAPFLVYPDKTAFILCHSSNPGAISLQEYPQEENPFYLHLIAEAKTWGTPEQLALELGSTSPEIFAKVRSIAPERLILARSIWEEKSNFKQILAAGLTKNGDGLLIPVPLDFLTKNDLVASLQSLNQEINQIREQIIVDSSHCDLWMSDVCLLNKHPHQDLVLQLYDIGCLLFGEYVQASGATFSYYIDLRKIISNPQIFHQVLQAYAAILQSLNFDRIAGIPYGSLPTATGLALLLNYPMIFPRKEVKAHGTRRLIEGNFNPGEKVVIVEDILITGKSAMEGAEKLKSSGLLVEDVVVLIDHEGGVKDTMKNNGYHAHSVLTISEITSILYEAGRLNEAQYSEIHK